MPDNLEAVRARLVQELVQERTDRICAACQNTSYRAEIERLVRHGCEAVEDLLVYDLVEAVFFPDDQAHEDVGTDAIRRFTFFLLGDPERLESALQARGHEKAHG